MEKRCSGGPIVCLASLVRKLTEAVRALPLLSQPCDDVELVRASNTTKKVISIKIKHWRKHKINLCAVISPRSSCHQRCRTLNVDSVVHFYSARDLCLCPPLNIISPRGTNVQRFDLLFNMPHQKHIQLIFVFYLFLRTR